MDNIFPEFDNNISWDIKYFSEAVRDSKNEGAVLEFGVCTGTSICDIAAIIPNRKIIGFDHFKGLEQTKQPHPPVWKAGAFRINDPDLVGWAPTSIEQVLNKTARYPHIEVFIEDIHKLKDPICYNITKIAGVHIDVDIYEPTVSALNFIDKCQWNQLIIRFDDWHGHRSEHGFDFHERLACREWLTKNNYQFSIPYNGSCGGVFVSR